MQQVKYVCIWVQTTDKTNYTSPHVCWNAHGGRHKALWVVMQLSLERSDARSLGRAVLKSLHVHVLIIWALHTPKRSELVATRIYVTYI